MTDQKTMIKVPEKAIKELEGVRMDLYALMGDKLDDPAFFAEFLNISERLWRIANTRYEEVE